MKEEIGSKENMNKSMSTLMEGNSNNNIMCNLWSTNKVEILFWPANGM